MEKKPFEVMAEVMSYGYGRKLADELGVTPDAVTRWKREPGGSGTGQAGPLDKIKVLIDIIFEREKSYRRAYPIGRYIAGLLNGVFVPNPLMQLELENGAMAHVSAVLKEAAEVVETFRQVWFENSPGRLSHSEHVKISAEIEDAITALVSMKFWIETKAKENKDG